MKYQFLVQKREEYDEKENDPMARIGSRGNERWDNVFSVEIEADEMIELMQHLWDIANRRRTK